jgi:hypothetical protein
MHLRITSSIDIRVSNTDTALVDVVDETRGIVAHVIYAPELDRIADLNPERREEGLHGRVIPAVSLATHAPLSFAEVLDE